MGLGLDLLNRINIHNRRSINSDVPSFRSKSRMVTRHVNMANVDGCLPTVDEARFSRETRRSQDLNNLQRFKDSKNQEVETEVKFEDWIEIGAFSKPTSSSGFRKTLYRKRFLVIESNRKLTFVMNEKPALAGVDPFSLMIDRNTANNMKKPTLLAE